MTLDHSYNHIVIDASCHVSYVRQAHYRGTVILRALNFVFVLVEPASEIVLLK